MDIQTGEGGGGGHDNDEALVLNILRFFSATLGVPLLLGLVLYSFCFFLYDFHHALLSVCTAGSIEDGRSVGVRSSVFYP